MLAVDNKVTEFLLSYGQKRIVKTGETFIREGDVADNCYVLLDGEADILVKAEDGSNNVVSRINKGTIVGEVGVFLKENRSSSVRAATPLILLEFTAPRFYSAVENNSELAIRIIKALAEKLNAANKFSLQERQ